MSDVSIEKIREIIDPSLCSPPEIHNDYLAKIAGGKPTRDEDMASHFCVYFLPYNPEVKKVFMIHHKKAGLWLSPGGHIDKGETPLETLEREIKEELGVIYNAPEHSLPFLLTLTPIGNDVQPCKVHYDLWYGIQTNGDDFKVDLTEFHNTKWLTADEAREIVVDQPNLQAIAEVERNFFEKLRSSE